MPGAAYVVMNHAREAATKGGNTLPMWAIGIIVLILLGLSGFMCFCIGVSTDSIDNRRNNWEDHRDGWLIRPFRRFTCGAFYGHQWTEPDDFMKRSGKWQICKYCGKVRVIKDHGQHGS